MKLSAAILVGSISLAGGSGVVGTLASSTATPTQTDTPTLGDLVATAGEGVRVSSPAESWKSLNDALARWLAECERAIEQYYLSASGPFPPGPAPWH